MSSNLNVICYICFFLEQKCMTSNILKCEYVILDDTLTSFYL